MPAGRQAGRCTLDLDFVGQVRDGLRGQNFGDISGRFQEGARIGGELMMLVFCGMGGVQIVVVVTLVKN